MGVLRLEFDSAGWGAAPVPESAGVHVSQKEGSASYSSVTAATAAMRGVRQRDCASDAHDDRSRAEAFQAAARSLGLRCDSERGPQTKLEASSPAEQHSCREHWHTALKCTHWQAETVTVAFDQSSFKLVRH
eukprot:603729-Rhodomonas_salina.1